MIDVVTGATSGLGLTLVRALLEKGHEVRAIIIEHPSTSEDWKRLPPKVIPYIADITLKRPDDFATLMSACKGATNIFHLAAATGLVGKPSFDTFISINVVGTENVLKAYVRANPNDATVRFIYVSTTGVYGDKRRGEMITEESETAPGRPYSETKLMGEQVVKSFAEVHSNVKYTIARVATMYGPHYHGPFYKVIKYLKEQRLPNIGSGMNHLTLIHTGDVVRGLVLMSERPQAVNKIYNLTDGQPYTLKQLFVMVSNQLGVPPPKRHLHPIILRLGARVMNVSGDEIGFLLSDRVVSIDKVKRELGFVPQVNVEDESKRMVSDFLRKYKG